MKVVIPTDDEKTVAPVFSRARKFIVYDSKTGDLRTIENPYYDDDEKVGKKVWKMLKELKIDAVAAPQLGVTLLEYVKRENVPYIIVDKGISIDEAFDEVKKYAHRVEKERKISTNNFSPHHR